MNKDNSTFDKRIIQSGSELNVVEEHEDIFDQIMKLPVLNRFEGFYKSKKEGLLYLFFGGLAFVVSMTSFAAFLYGVHMNELLANIFSWVVTVAFAYVTNKIWVFQSKTRTIQKFLQEVVFFFSGRLITLGIEEAILLVFITLLHFNAMGVKLVAQVVIIVLNYVISKFLIFGQQ